MKKVNDGKAFYLSLFFLAAILLVTGCGGGKGQADAKKPWSVLIKSYRQSEDASIAVDRLRSMKYDSYYLPRMEENNDIWFDVHVGKYADRKAAEAVKARLSKDRLPDVRIANYSNYISNVTAYEQASAEDKKEYQTRYEMPKIAPAVEKTMRCFPVDSDYKIVDMRLAHVPLSMSNKMGNIGFQLNTSMIPGDDKLVGLVEDAQALSQAVYEDKLFGHEIGVLVLLFTNPDMAAAAATNEYRVGKPAAEAIRYRTDNGTLRGNIYRKTINNKDRFTFVGCIDRTGYFVVYQTSDLSLQELTGFVTTGNRNKGLLLYPEVLRNLSVFPKDSDSKTVKLAAFMMNRVPWSYAADRGYAWWAKNMVGNWTLTGYYVYEEKPVAISFFSVNYEKTALKLHNNFIQEKKKLQDNEYVAAFMRQQGMVHKAVDVNRHGGWYMDQITFNELSFASGSYIIAIASAEPVKTGYSNLQAAAMKLNIW